MTTRNSLSYCVCAVALGAGLALLSCSGDTNPVVGNSPDGSESGSGSGNSSGTAGSGSAGSSGSGAAGNSAGSLSSGSGSSGGSGGANASGSGATASGGDGRVDSGNGGADGGDATASNEDGGVDSGNGGADGGGGTTFSQVYKILSTHCCSTCHAPTATAGTPTDGCVARNVMKNTGFTGGNLDMSTQPKAYTSLVGVACMGTRCRMKNLKRVVAGNSAMSVMYSKITTVAPALAICGEAMPYDQAQLPAADIATIKMWIDEGAPDN